ncbi:MAG: hypothetical protein H7039_23430 [Bryobacteraceae bacterium]|nr:hypothetical protein [Bryobacteraceae bacterium]
MQVWRMDLKSGESRQLTDVSSLDPSCVSLTQNERSLCYVDGERLIVQTGTRMQIVYSVETGWQAAGGFALSEDGLTASLVEKRNGRFRLRLMSMRAGGGARTIYEADQPVRFCRFRPKRSSLLYNYNGVLTLVNFDGRGSRRLAITGNAGFALWSADGRAVQYLSIPEGRASIQLREHLPETGEDQLIGGTTQFVSFARNGDSTVFAGISGSKGAPYVLLFVRTARRELTVAEHKASDARNAVVAFSVNSQRLFYNTDREGRPAIYSMPLERFIEDTEAPV